MQNMRENMRNLAKYAKYAACMRHYDVHDACDIKFFAEFQQFLQQLLPLSLLNNRLPSYSSSHKKNTVQKTI